MIFFSDLQHKNEYQKGHKKNEKVVVQLTCPEYMVTFTPAANNSSTCAQKQTLDELKYRLYSVCLSWVSLYEIKSNEGK